MADYAGFEASVYYKQETTPGTTPAGQWKALAQKVTVRVRDSPNPNFSPKSGSVDSAKPTKGVTEPVAIFTINPSLGSGKDFIKNFISTDNFFSLLLVKIDTPSNFVFQRLVGCKVKRGNPSCTFGKIPQYACEVWAFNIAYDEGTTPTYEAIPDTLLNWSDITIKTVADPGGTNPTRSNLTQWNSFDWTVENELMRIYDKDGTTTNIKRGEREKTGTLEIVLTNTGQTEYDAAKNATPQDIEFLFSTDSYLFNDCAYTDVDTGHEEKSLSDKVLNFRAATLTIT